MMKRTIRGSLFAMSVVLAGVICLDTSCRQNNSSQPVKIAAILPLTGFGAEFGKDEQIGAQMAIDEINATPNGVRFELVVEDSRTQPKDGVSAYQKLSSASRKPVAILSVMSSVCSAIAPLAERDGVPLFCVAAAPALTQGRKYIFRSLPAATHQAQSLVEQSKGSVKFVRVSVIFFQDEFGRTMEASFRTAAEANEISVIQVEGVPNDTSDFRPSLAKLAEASPEAIFVAALGSSVPSILRQLRELGFKGYVLAPIELGYPEVLKNAGAAAEGALYIGSRFDVAANDQATERFVAEFRRRAGRLPSLDAVLAYDEIRMIYDAGRRNEFTGDGIRKGLLGIRDFMSLNGPCEILPNGDVKYHLTLKKVKDGKGEPVQ